MGICNASIDFIPLQENKEIYFLFMWFVQKLTKAGNYMTKGVKCREKHLRWGACYSTVHHHRRFPVNFTYNFRANTDLSSKLE